MFAKLESIERRYVHIEDSLLDPNLDSAQLKKLTKERAEIEEIVASYREHKAVKKEWDDAREMLESGEPDLRALAQAELDKLQEKLDEIAERLTLLLLPSDPRDSRNVILEI
ncbi:MAG: PCRF domain-containing protein, partial [Deltaproteobacteria bacterium]|nr:PCRF domain-containing protein [Deltaproteobacteria bacterium]